MEDFAATLVAARERRGLTQAQLAVSAGLTPSYVCLLENRKKPPPSDAVCERLADVLGVPPRELLEVAHVQRSPATVQRRLRSLSGKLSKEQRSRHRLMDSLLSPLLVASPTGWLESAVEWIGGGAAKRRRLREVLAALGRRHLDRAEAVSSIIDKLPERDRQLLLEAIPRMLGREAARQTQSPELFYSLPEADATPDRPFLLAWAGKGDAEIGDGDLVLLDPRLAPQAGDLVVTRGPDGTPLARRVGTAEGGRDALGGATQVPGAGNAPAETGPARPLVVVEIRRPLRRQSP